MLKIVIPKKLPPGEKRLETILIELEKIKTDIEYVKAEIEKLKEKLKEKTG